MWGFLGGSVVKQMPANAGLQGDSGLILSREDLREEKTAAHFSILAWTVPWTEELEGQTKLITLALTLCHLD